jgi:hypothetical protein
MTIQPITYRGRTIAAATRSRFFLADALDQRPAGDPELTFVIFMCAYAGDVLSGILPGPYTRPGRPHLSAPPRHRRAAASAHDPQQPVALVVADRPHPARHDRSPRRRPPAGTGFAIHNNDPGRQRGEPCRSRH